jgi:hypothetical protein
MALRDRVNVPRGPIAGGLLAAVAWLVLSAVFGSVEPMDLVVAAILVGGGVLRQRTTRKRTGNDRGGGIYGPPS